MSGNWRVVFRFEDGETQSCYNNFFEDLAALISRLAFAALRTPPMAGRLLKVGLGQVVIRPYYDAPRLETPYFVVFSHIHYIALPGFKPFLSQICGITVARSIKIRNK